MLRRENSSAGRRPYGMVNVLSASFLKQELYRDALTLWVPDPETLMLRDRRWSRMYPAAVREEPGPPGVESCLLPRRRDWPDLLIIAQLNRWFSAAKPAVSQPTPSSVRHT